jgi:hypothetical protein
MFTYSTNLRGAITTTANTIGGSAILDEEEEKVYLILFHRITMPIDQTDLKNIAYY